MLKENKSGDAGQEHFLGAFHNNIQKSPPGWDRVQSKLKAAQARSLQENVAF